MHPGISEQEISCPFCGEPLTILLDLTVGKQTYIEDCQVCCQPMLVSYDVVDGQPVEIGIDRA